jgi:hypothetical protein
MMLEEEPSLDQHSVKMLSGHAKICLEEKHPDTFKIWPHSHSPCHEDPLQE